MTEREFEELEQREHDNTLLVLSVMYLMLDGTKDSILKELRAFYGKYAKNGVVTFREARRWISQRNHTKRITEMYNVIDEQFNKLNGSLGNEFEKAMAFIIAEENEFFGLQLNPKHLKWGVDDKDWSARLVDDIEKWSATIKNDIKLGLVRQDELDKMEQTVEKKFKSMKNVLTTLAITESSAVNTIMHDLAFSKLGYSKYKYYALQDERTCETCGSLHGLIFPMSAYEVGVTAPPMHTNCRCTTIPI